MQELFRLNRELLAASPAQGQTSHLSYIPRNAVVSAIDDVTAAHPNQLVRISWDGREALVFAIDLVNRTDRILIANSEDGVSPVGAPRTEVGRTGLSRLSETLDALCGSQQELFMGY